MVTLPEIAKAKRQYIDHGSIIKTTFYEINACNQSRCTDEQNSIILMTQMRNITTVMFATANGHIGKGASVADNFRILFDDFVGKNKDPQKLKETLEEALENGVPDSSTIAQELEQLIQNLWGHQVWVVKQLHKVKLQIKL